MVPAAGGEPSLGRLVGEGTVPHVLQELPCRTLRFPLPPPGEDPFERVVDAVLDGRRAEHAELGREVVGEPLDDERVGA